MSVCAGARVRPALSARLNLGEATHDLGCWRSRASPACRPPAGLPNRPCHCGRYPTAARQGWFHGARRTTVWLAQSLRAGPLAAAGGTTGTSGISGMDKRAGMGRCRRAVKGFAIRDCDSLGQESARVLSDGQTADRSHVGSTAGAWVTLGAAPVHRSVPEVSSGVGQPAEPPRRNVALHGQPG